MSILQIRLAIVAVFISLLVASSWAAKHYYDQSSEYKEKLSQSNSVISQMQEKEKNAAQLDTQYTQQIKAQQDTIDSLRSDISNGSKRLRVSATCKPGKSTGASSVGDDATPELDRTAVENYLTLRQRIITITNQVNYLQDYIRQQCLAQPKKQE